MEEDVDIIVQILVCLSHHNPINLRGFVYDRTHYDITA